MKIRALQIACFIPLLSVLISCQTLGNRRPQSAGFGGYCPTCITQNIDKDLAKLQSTLQKASKQPPKVRYATIFNKEGKAICRVDLLKHPSLVPNFAKTKKHIVHQAKKFKRGLASEKSELPPCPQAYLNRLKQAANNNILINNTSHIHKTSMGVVAGLITACALGTLASTTSSYSKANEKPDAKSNAVGPTATATVAVGGTIAASGTYTLTKTMKPFMDIMSKKDPFVPTSDALKNYAKKRSELSQWDKIKSQANKIPSGGISKRWMLATTAAIVGSLCYLGSEYGAVVYK